MCYTARSIRVSISLRRDAKSIGLGEKRLGAVSKTLAHEASLLVWTRRSLRQIWLAFAWMRPELVRTAVRPARKFRTLLVSMPPVPTRSIGSNSKFGGLKTYSNWKKPQLLQRSQTAGASALHSPCYEPAQHSDGRCCLSAV